ncbi:MAG: hypothetical protein A2275_09655 [Bacteroidetes bacterium RIFOXYA12_FULL_35_11]|nr:MAG: hypothetical protein A2X01_08625 [Bacteroidetes bacterium GWF2_35_48]OFY74818.1 MAG: hypothetical protein A2275_09655 [Bacteroidetes bacterium RIFOXYA12_FULL_35_11]OFY97943.1 MAG: hypothetical protein A2491_03635 [Bacteroidetes bacterium RIFOXYC12_FULL_35_7]HBX52473.1 hypothetical protein [Bacteroidales bacterium]
MATIKHIIRTFFITVGVYFFLSCIIALTPYPFWLRHWMGTSLSAYHFKPDYIIMLGGNGMPSDENLMRLYFAAESYKEFPNAEIVILHQFDTNSIRKMKEELMLRGVPGRKIQFELHGTNTRSQCLALSKHFPQTFSSKILIVTSPEHVLRSVLTFRKVGYKLIGACPAFETNTTANLNYKTKKIGGKKYIPDVGSSIGLRYNFWNYLKLEIICLRELVALGYYQWNGWI